MHWDSRVDQDSHGNGALVEPHAAILLTNSKIENITDVHQPGSHASMSWSRTVALPTSFEATEHATAADLASLTKSWQKDGSDDGVFAAQQLPSIAFEHHGASDATVRAFHFRGMPHVSSLTESNKATVHVIAATVTTPVVDMKQAAQRHIRQDAALNAFLGSVWSQRNPQPVRMGCGSASSVSNSDWVSVESSDMQHLTPAPVKDAFGLKKLSAWAFIAYASLACGLFLVSALWMGFVLTRALLSMLCAVFMRKERSSAAEHDTETVSSVETPLLVFKDAGKESP